MVKIGRLSRSDGFIADQVELEIRPDHRRNDGEEGWYGEAWLSTDAFVIPGDTSDESVTGPWSKLDALLERSFHHELGAELRIAKLAVDSGFNTTVGGLWT